MSYNITTFKLKKIDDLQIPIESLYKFERPDWHPKKIINEDHSVEFIVGCDCFLHGFIKDDMLLVTAFDCDGEGSGCAMSYIFEPAFKDSTGKLEAVCVWEGGDEIDRLVVEDGKVEWKSVEL